MAIGRFFKNEDGNIISRWFNPLRFPEQESHMTNDPYKDLLPERLKDLPFILIDEEHPAIQRLRSDRDLDILDNNKLSMDKMYFDGDAHIDNLKVDDNWEVLLMPLPIVKAKHIAKINAEIDAELALETPDAVLVSKKQRELEKSRNYPDPSWYPIALANLDARVTKGEPDKPVIRQKLIDKISGATPDMQPTIGVKP